MAAHVKHLSDTNKKWNKVFKKIKNNEKELGGKGKGKDTRIEIFVNGIDNVEVTPDNLQNYMESNFINVVRLVRLSGENKQHASYLLVVPISSYYKVMNDVIWEDGITVRDFTR